MLGPSRQGVHIKEGTWGLIDRLTNGKTVECPEDRDDSISILYEGTVCFGGWGGRTPWAKMCMSRDP